MKTKIFKNFRQKCFNLSNKIFFIHGRENSHVYAKHILRKGVKTQND